MDSLNESSEMDISGDLIMNGSPDRLKEKSDDSGDDDEEEDEPGMQRKDYIQMRLAELDEQNSNIAARTDVEFLKRKAQIDDEYNLQRKKLDDFHQIQHQSVSRRTIGEHAWLQSSTEQEITEFWYKHNKAMYPSDNQLLKEYDLAMHNYKFLDEDLQQN